MIKNEDLLEKLAKCVSACEYCSDACLNETDRLEMLVECIRLNRDCADACALTIKYISRGSRFVDDMITLCETLCRECAEECEKHDTDHCKACARACRECEEACVQMEA